MKVGIVGGGHNALVLAGYLGKDAFDVTVFEARDRVGGLCVNEEVFPGHKISVVATYFGMFRRQIIEDLRLDQHGLQPYLTDPAEIVLLPGGGFVFTPRDGSDSKISAGDLSEEQIAGWKRFWGDMGKAAALISPFYFEPDTTQKQLVELISKNGLSVIADNLFDGCLFDVFDHYCTNAILKAAAATCTPGFAANRGSVYGCLHHGTAETCGVQGAWGLVRGGMGAVSESLAASVTRYSVKIRTNAPVEKIIVENGKAVGVQLGNGERHDFDVVVSGCDPVTTLKKLVGREHLSSTLSDRLEVEPSRVSAGKVHFLLKRLPKFKILDELGHNYAGIIVVAPAVDKVIADAERVGKGFMTEDLMMTMAFPTVTDETVAPAGEHHMNIDIHCLPVSNNGVEWDESNKSIIVDAVIAALKVHAPDIEDVILDSYVVSPTDLKKRFGVETAMCWHLPMTSEFVFEKRILPDCGPYTTPIENLYSCGASAYGGGNVTGIAGLNCAKVVKESRLLSTAGNL